MDTKYRKIYRELSSNLEKVQQQLHGLDSPIERLLCAVLVDDIESLMEECESFLVDGCGSEDEQEAFIMRYEIVTDEVADVTRMHDHGAFRGARLGEMSSRE